MGRCSGNDVQLCSVCVLPTVRCHWRQHFLQIAVDRHMFLGKLDCKGHAHFWAILYRPLCLCFFEFTALLHFPFLCFTIKYALRTSSSTQSSTEKRRNRATLIFHQFRCLTAHLRTMAGSRQHYVDANARHARKRLSCFLKVSSTLLLCLTAR